MDFDHGINNAIKRLREALGDTAETPHYVETLPRRGYRFIGKLEREAPKFRSLAVLPLENLSSWFVFSFIFCFMPCSSLLVAVVTSPVPGRVPS